MRAFLATATTVALAGLLIAATQVIDGLNVTQTPWPAPAAVQDTNTRFGDNQNELNQMFLDSDASNLYIGLSGNLSDVNSLVIFIDTNPAAGPGGVLDTESGTCPTQGTLPQILTVLDGTTFDANFAPDYGLHVSVGKFPGQSDTRLVFASDLLNLNSLANTSLGIGAFDSGNGLLTGNSGIQIAVNNSNTAGVISWDTQANADPNLPPTATTGIEVAIPKSLLGVSGGNNIRLLAYISNDADGFSADPNSPCQKQGFGSNQALPGLQGSDNLGLYTGGSFSLDFGIVAGQQWVGYTLN